MGIAIIFTRYDTFRCYDFFRGVKYKGLLRGTFRQDGEADSVQKIILIRLKTDLMFL